MVAECNFVHGAEWRWALSPSSYPRANSVDSSTKNESGTFEITSGTGVYAGAAGSETFFTRKVCTGTTLALGWAGAETVGSVRLPNPSQRLRRWCCSGQDLAGCSSLWHGLPGRAGARPYEIRTAGTTCRLLQGSAAGRLSSDVTLARGISAGAFAKLDWVVGWQAQRERQRWSSVL